MQAVNLGEGYAGDIESFLDAHQPEVKTDKTSDVAYEVGVAVMIGVSRAAKAIARGLGHITSVLDQSTPRSPQE